MVKKHTLKEIEKLIKNLVKTGKKNGFLAYDEIMNAFNQEPAQKAVEAILEFFKDKDIKVTNIPSCFLLPTKNDQPNPKKKKYNHRSTKFQEKVSRQKANLLIDETTPIYEGDDFGGAKFSHFDGIKGNTETKVYQVLLKHWNTMDYYDPGQNPLSAKKFGETGKRYKVEHKKEYYSTTELRFILLEMERRIEMGYQ